MARILVTGASRGLGLEFIRQLGARGDMVWATCRDPHAATELNNLASERVRIVRLDTADEASIAAARETVGAQTSALDVLINNAGVSSAKADRLNDGTLTFDDGLAVFRTNAFGPLLVTQAFRDLLRAGENARVVNVSSGYGSLTHAGAGWPYYYCASKAALNMFTRIAAGDLKGDNVSVIAMDPGWVKTDMGGANAQLTPEQSIAGMLEVIDGLTGEGSGRFLTWQGSEAAW